MPAELTPEPPYYAVIFTSQRTPGDRGYVAMADRMEELARKEPGFLGIESARNTEGFGITVSYWDSEASIARWRANMEHRQAQALGRSTWYEGFSIRVARVERAHGQSAARSDKGSPSGA
jgi:heme-degrading monooxygenase HmoA